MLSDEEIAEKVKIIRKAYAERPKNDTTVDAMIAQGLRTGIALGQARPRPSIKFGKA